MSDSIKALREQRDALAKEARNINDKATGDYDAARVDQILDDIDHIDARVKNEKRLLDIEARLDVDAADPDASAPRGGKSQDGRPGDEVRAQVFEAYLRGGDKAVNRLPETVLADYAKQVQNAQSTGVESEGGALVPTTFGGKLIEAMKGHGGMRLVASVQPMSSGETIQWPTVDETGEEGEWTAENADVTDGDVTFGTVSIGAHKASSKVITIPIELLRDSGIGDIEGVINGMLATRLARTTNKAYTIGDGTGKPTGVVPASSVGHTTAAGMVASFTFDDFIELEHSVDPAYRGNARWMFSDAALKSCKKVKDSEGRPLWLPGVTGVAPAEINGYQYIINQDVAVPAASAKSVAFGDFSKYLIRDVMDVTLYRFTDSAYAKKGQVGFLAMLRTDGKLIAADNKAIRVMQHAAA